MPLTSPSEQPLNILHTESSTGWGGQEIRILTEAAGMIARGHRVMLITPPEACIAAAAPRYGIPVLTLPIAKKRLPGLLALRRWLVDCGAQFDVINTHSSTDSWLTALARATLPKATVARLPSLVRTRHVSTVVKGGGATRWLYLQATAHVVVTGEALRQQLHRESGLPLDHLTSVRTGIDLLRFSPFAERREMRRRLGLPERPTVGIVATLRDWKGHDYLFDAFARLKQDFPAWQLVIVGDGPRLGHLRDLAPRLGVDEDIHFVGNRDDVPDWLNAFDLFVLPSYGEEGVPQGIMQAMACGLPVVSTPVGAIAEVVTDGKTGILVAPRDSAVLATALGCLMADSDLRTRFGTAGLTRARESFGLDPMLDQMEAVFRRYSRRSA